MTANAAVGSALFQYLFLFVVACSHQHFCVLVLYTNLSAGMDHEPSPIT